MGGLSDLSLKDQQWFSRPQMFSRAVSIEAPPLNPTTPVPPDQLISSAGACPGLSAAPATAMSDPGSPTGAPVTTTGGSVALGHAECDVARAIGVPDNVSISANARGDRLAVLTYNRGGRARIYTFTSGRLTSIDKAPTIEPEPKPTHRSKSRRAS